MRPFKADYLSNPSAQTPEDVFELVGILVHAGTAESGHYYSYIRERPSSSSKDNWIEFNDDNVVAWDPGYMEAACFGGPDRGPLDTGTLPYDKNYSAYMLFYQRSSVVVAQKQALEDKKLSSPIRLPLPPILSNHIATENEMLMRRYCLYDSSHIVFVSKMLANMKKVNDGCCSKSHSLEKRALWVAMNHLDQVVSRAKDLPDFVSFMLGIRQICQSCGECSRDFLEWFYFHPEGFKQLLVRNPEVLVRGEIAQAILTALAKVKSDASYAYGLREASVDDDTEDDPQVIIKIVDGLDKLFEVFHTNCRAWPEYFGLLASIANMGRLEAILLLDLGFLRKVLDIVNADPLLSLTPQLSRMLNIVTKRLSTRPVNYEAVIDLLLKLLEVCDASEEPVSDTTPRLHYDGDGSGIPFSTIEHGLITQHWTRTNSHIFTEKLLQIHQNPLATRQIVINLLNWPNEELDIYIYHTLTTGTRKAASPHPSSPFLRAAVIYCEHSPSDNALLLINHISKVAGHVNNAEGRAFLHFFKEAMALQSTATNSPFTTEQISDACLDNVGFWGPGLLVHFDATVRTETEDYLSEVIFTQAVQETSKAPMLADIACKLGIACLDYLHETFIRPRQTVVRATLSSIQATIESATPFFDENEQDMLSQKFFDMKTC